MRTPRSKRARPGLPKGKLCLLLLCARKLGYCEGFPVYFPAATLQPVWRENRWQDLKKFRPLMKVGPTRESQQDGTIRKTEHISDRLHSVLPKYIDTNGSEKMADETDKLLQRNNGKSELIVNRWWRRRRKANETSVQSLWKRRHARTAVEGIRSGKITQLDSLLAKVGSYELKGRRYAARTITGLIKAIAVETEDLEVEVDTKKNTPLWGKHVEAVRIKFTRLEFKPFRMGGFLESLPFVEENSASSYIRYVKEKFLNDVPSADEAFTRIDVDNSGALDSDEIASALQLAAGGTTPDLDPNIDKREMMKALASDLVALYDANGDGVVDRAEYQRMVADMAELASQQQTSESNELIRETLEFENATVAKANATPSLFLNPQEGNRAQDVSSSHEIVDSLSKSIGSITFSDLKLDLRRLVFGMVPVLKHIVPGGHLVLEPFTATVTGSFTPNDIMNSFILENGLKRVVARVLRVRVRSIRDIIDLAVFTGRTWNAKSPTAPQVDFPDIENVEFDAKNRMIITGRARVRAYPGAPKINQAFKVRLKIGTRENGRVIRVVEPELAFVLECPKKWENAVTKVCSDLNIERPERPSPLYSFFPVYSPFKLEDKVGGFDLGADNCIKSIFVEDNALQFEISAVLRPGRFLGNHYLAFTIPIRTVIITLDRVKEGMREARKQKQKMKAQRTEKEEENSISEDIKLREPMIGPKPSPKLRKPKSFFTRFVEGYMQGPSVASQQDSVALAIKEFFARQSLRRL